MADYDGSIRIGTGIDTKGFDEDGKELEEKAKKLGKSLSNSAEIEVKVDASGTEKEFEKVFDDIEKEEKRIEELAKRAVERARVQQETAVAPQAAEELRPFTPGYNQDAIKHLEEYSEKADETSKHFNFLKQNAEELAKNLLELQKEGKFFGDTDYDKIYVAWKNATDAIKDYRKELEKDTESGMAKAAEQEAKAAEKQAAAEAKIAAKEAERQAKEEARIAAIQAKEEAKRAKEVAAIQAQEVEEQRLDQIRENAVESNDQIIAKVERIKQLEQEIVDLKTVGRTEGYADYDNRIKELSELKRSVNEYKDSLSTVPEKFEKMRASAKKAFNAITSGTKESSKSLSGGLKTILKYGLGIRSLYTLFNKIRSGIQAGFTNLMGYSDSFANSVQSVKNSTKTLGNQIAGAFRPIVEMVIPWINSLINALAAAMAKLAQFIALLTGASTFTRAKKIQDAYNKSLGGTAKAADKARGALAAFDDLDVLEKKEDASGGAGGLEETLPKDMFEEVPIDNKLIGWLDDLLARLNELKAIFMEGFWDGLGDWESRWKSIKSSVETIKDTLAEIWTDPEVIASQNQYYDSLLNMLGSLAGSALNIGLTIATNLVGGIALYLEQNKGRITEYIRDMFDIGTEINGIIAEFSKSFAFIFEAFGSEQAQQLTANIIGIFSDAFMGATKLAGKFAADVIDIITRPFIDSKEDFRTVLEDFLGTLEEVSGTVKDGIDNTFDKLNETYDEHFAPFFNSMAEDLSDTVGKFLDFWNNQVQPILDEWAASFDQLWKEHIQPMLDKFGDMLGDIADYLKAVWEESLKPFIDWIIENVLPLVLPVIDKIVKSLMEAAGVIFDVIGGIIDVIGGIIQFLTGTLTGNWEKVWDGIKKIFGGVWDAIKSILFYALDIIWDKISIILDSIKAIISNTLEAIKAVINLVINAIKSQIETALNVVKAIWTTIFESLKNSVQEIWGGIKKIFEGFTTFLSGVFTKNWEKAWDGVVKIFSGIGDAIKGIINGVIGGVESMANGVINAINAMIRALNAIHFDIPDWVPALGGKSFGFSIGEIPNVTIPKLATGAVIRGGNPFVAILGDQPAGKTNIEAPLATIEQAVENVMSRQGYGRESVPVTINLNYDGETFARLSISDILGELGRQGYNVDVLGVT